jgi:tRNA-dihydrouridine synthase
MEGVTDFATRIWFQWIGGMDFVWTPFLRVTDTFPLRYGPDFAPELDQLRGVFKAPLILQVMGSRPDDIVRTHDLYGDRVAFIDLNCGCPSPTVVGSRAGSSLLERQDYFGDFISSVSRRVGPERLSVKMRTGFHDASEFAGLLAAISSLPLRHLTVHGRTRPQKYKGKADWDLVQRAARHVAFPVFGSGDLSDFNGIQTRFAETRELGGAIVGRGALRNPWIFSGATHAPVLPALAVFILAQDFQLERLSGLIDLAGHLSDEVPAGDDAGRWITIAEKLASARGLQSGPMRGWSVSPRALARGKMLWNYLRSSLPEPFMDPTLMRVKDLGGLLDGIQHIARAHHFDVASLPVRHQSHYDWMFSGEGKTPPANQKE